MEESGGGERNCRHRVGCITMDGCYYVELPDNVFFASSESLGI